MGWQPQESPKRENQDLDLTVLIPKWRSESRAGCVYQEKRKNVTRNVFQPMILCTLSPRNIGLDP